DGRWIAYVSDESGREEVYLRAFPQPEGRWQVSANGGSQPRWQRDGRALFFVSPEGRLMATEVRTTPAPVMGNPRVLLELEPGARYEPAPGGTQFVSTRPGEAPVRERPQAILTWTSELGRRR